MLLAEHRVLLAALLVGAVDASLPLSDAVCVHAEFVSEREARAAHNRSNHSPPHCFRNNHESILSQSCFANQMDTSKTIDFCLVPVIIYRYTTGNSPLGTGTWGFLFLALPLALKILERLFCSVPFWWTGTRCPLLDRLPARCPETFGVSRRAKESLWMFSGGAYDRAVWLPFGRCPDRHSGCIQPCVPALPMSAAGSVSWPCTLQHPRGVALVA